MKHLSSSLTSKGQVTVPKEVRLLLGLEPHDRVTFVVDGDEVRLERGSVVARTAGVFRSLKPALTIDELRRVAEEAIASEVVERGQA